MQINADGTFTYNPPANYEGTDTFTYTVCNGNGFSTANVTITVTPTVYVKLVRQSRGRENVNIVCDFGNGNQTVNCGFSWKANYIVSFYLDAAGTIPYNVSGLNFKVNINECTSVNGGAYSCSVWQSSTLSGTSVTLLTDYIYQDTWCDCYGGNRDYSKTLALAAGAYIIIT